MWLSRDLNLGLQDLLSDALPTAIWSLSKKRMYYGKCPKNSNTKASDKMTYANSVDPDQTAPSGAVWSGSTLFAIPLNI